MPDSLYLSLWFSSFDESDILPRAVSVLAQFPFSSAQYGVTYIATHPVSWNEPTILERRFRPGLPPEEAAEVLADLLHDDYAYVFEAYWDLWAPPEGSEKWVLQPLLVRFIAQGAEFEEGAAEQTGHMQIDFGLDMPFLYEELSLTAETEERVKSNVQKLVAFTAQLEKKAGATGRLLWSESEENLAQKLIARLQRTH
jgi:hypothetical protein